MLSLQEISDQIELQNLCFQYSNLLDQRDFDGMRDLFAEDAHIDYSAMGGGVGNLEETIEFLKGAMTSFKGYQHLNSNMHFTVDGDAATGRVMCFNPMELDLGDGSVHSFMLGLWYNDKYKRTDTGWCFQERVEEKSWMLNEPEFMKALRD